MQGRIKSTLLGLLRDYCSLVPPRLISIPDDASFTDLNEFLVGGILSSQHLQRFPPSEQYQKSFWKTLISHLEHLQRCANDACIECLAQIDTLFNLILPKDSELEIDDRILEHYLSLLPPGVPPSGSSQAGVRDQICGLGLPIRQLPTKSFITHLWKPEGSAPDRNGDIDLSQLQTTTLQESRTTIESGTTGLRTWGASLRLAEYFIAQPDLIRNRRVLELGAGIGFLGIVVATLQQLLQGVSPLWLTDVNDEVLSQCHQNVALDCNSSSKHLDVHYRTLDWFDALDEKARVHSFLQECSPDIILGADIVFDPTLIDPLAALLSQTLRHGSSAVTAVIALTVRNEETYQRFLSAVKGCDLQVEEINFECETPMFIETVEASVARDNVKILNLTV